MSEASDLFVQFQVRLENLKEGEARAVVSLLDNVQQELQVRLEAANTEWSRARLTDQIRVYDDALDAVFANGILPKLDVDGLVFTGKVQAYQAEAITTAITGTPEADRLAIARTLGYDVDNPVFRGVPGDYGETVGRYYTSNPNYANQYALAGEIPDYFDDIAKAPSVGKFYLPKDGFVDTSDRKLQTEFRNWLFEKHPAVHASYHADYIKGNIINQELEAELDDFLTERYSHWRYTNVREPDLIDSSDVTYILREGHDDVIRSVYSDFSLEERRKAAAIAQGFDVDRPLYRGTKTPRDTVGRWYTPNPEYASRYTALSYGSGLGSASGNTTIQPQMTKVYAKGKILDTTTDKRLRKSFEVWYATNYTDLDAVYDNSGRLIYAFQPEFEEYLSSSEFKKLKIAKKKAITGYVMSEQVESGDTSVYIRKKKNLKNAYDDFGVKDPKSKAAQTAAATNPGAAIVTTNVSPAAIFTAATAEPMQGKLMKEWATQLVRKDKAAVASALTQAWLEGESTAASYKRLRPILMRSQRDLKTITRTYYAHLASETQRAVWNENSDLMEGIIWDATLDNRTTLDICAPRDTLRYTLKGEPIGHGYPWRGGPGQAHWNCRSIGLPDLKGVDMTVDRRALSAGKNYERGDNLTRTGRVRKNSLSAREKGIYKQDTNIPVGTTYEDWLRSQPVAYQQDVLGVAKAEAFRKKKYRLGDQFRVVRPTTVGNF